MSDSRVEIATVALPPSEEQCFAGFCLQKACCDVELKEEGSADTWYVLPLCQAHALFALTGPLSVAAEKFPGDVADVPPWEG